MILTISITTITDKEITKVSTQTCHDKGLVSNTFCKNGIYIIAAVAHKEIILAYTNKVFLLKLVFKNVEYNDLKLNA